MTKAIVSQQIILCRDKKTQQATRIKEEKFVASEIAKDIKKSCRNRENCVVTELTV